MTERVVGRWIARAILVVGIVLLLGNWGEVTQAGTTSVDSVWDRIFAAREVVVAARVALMLGCFYLAGTFVALSVEGRWLVRAGPAGAEVEDLEDAQIVDEESTSFVEDLEGEMAKFRSDLATVKDGLAMASDNMVEVQQSIDVLFEAVDEMQERAEP
jgi:hypothetical protein